MLSDAFLRRCCLLAILPLLLIAGRPAAASVGPTITYTGQLLSGTTPLTGTYDFQFTLYNAATGGSVVGSPLTITSVTVADGIFYTELNFGSVFTGSALYLQTAYRVHPTSGSPAYTLQTPRKLIATSAVADYANTANYANTAGYATVSNSTNALKGFWLSATPPTNGQVLTWSASGNKWLPQTPAAASTLSLPLTESVSSSSDLFTLTNTGSGRAIVGNSSTNTAVKGIYGAASGLTGFFTSAVLGDTNTGNGVIGRTSAGGGYGVLGITDTNGTIGVYGTTANTSGTGVEGQGGAYGVAGYGVTYGVYGSSGTYGVYGSSGTYGVYGTDTANGTYGILGSKSSYGWDTGVVGESEGTTIYKIGVEGKSLADSGFGIWGVGDETGTKTGNYAGYFSGNVYVGGTLIKAGGSFKIDDPLDPAHKYLSHSFVESPDMKNIYDGTTTTDASGNATITLPDYFEVLNQDFRYQLTCMGQFAQAIVATEIDGNQFTIKTDKPDVKVSWQVTGTRHDAWANAHRIPTEEDKPKGEIGRYLHPREFGMPESLAIMPQHPGAAAQPPLPKQLGLPPTQQ